MNFIKKIEVLFIISLLLTITASAQESLKDTIEIEEVIITGTRVEVARKNVPLTISTVNRQEIELSNESAVLPVLSQRIPGMFVTERGVTGFGVATGSAGQINIRGVGGTAPNTQVLVLIDGHPQFQGIFGHPLPDAYVSSDVEKIEVIRGPASIIYGSNAMAGAINIITKQQTKEGLSGNAKFSYGSYNTQKYMASGGYKKGPFKIFASINHNRTDGHRDTSEFKIVNGYIKTGYDINKHFSITADVSIADFNAQDPGPVFNPALFGIDIFRGKSSLAVKNQFSKAEGGMIVFYNFGNHDLTDGWVSRDYHTGISLYQGLKLFQGNTITFGTDLKTVAGIGSKGMGADKWQYSTDIAGYTYIQQILFERLTLNTGIRLENNNIFGLETVPQAGFSWIAGSNSTIKGSVSKGFRNPSLMELFLYAPNPELKPERLMNYELGINKRSPDKRLMAELTLFLIEGDNVIEVMPNDNPPPPEKRQNSGSFTNKGVEIEINYRAHPNFNLSSNYAYINLDRPRLAAPKNQMFVEATYYYKKLRANLSLQQISGLYISTDPVLPLEENYSLVNLMLSYKLNKNIDFFASGKNLLDQKYSVNFGYPMPGITVFSGINLSF
jgi:outer membrane receptor protein involved in Fe transport